MIEFLIPFIKMAKFDYDDALLLMHNLQNCQQVILQMKGRIFFVFPILLEIEFALLYKVWGSLDQ